MLVRLSADIRGVCAGCYPLQGALPEGGERLVERPLCRSVAHGDALTMRQHAYAWSVCFLRLNNAAFAPRCRAESPPAARTVTRGRRHSARGLRAGCARPGSPLRSACTRTSWRATSARWAGRHGVDIMRRYRATCGPAWLALRRARRHSRRHRPSPGLHASAGGAPTERRTRVGAGETYLSVWAPRPCASSACAPRYSTLLTHQVEGERRPGAGAKSSDR